MADTMRGTVRVIAGLASGRRRQAIMKSTAVSTNIRNAQATAAPVIP